MWPFTEERKLGRNVKIKSILFIYFLVAVTLVVFWSSSTSAAQIHKRIFNIDEAITIAVTNNFDVLVLKHEKEIQEEIVNGSLQRMLPSLVLEAERTWKSDHVPSKSLNFATGEESLAASISSDLETRKESIGLSWNLLNLALEINRYEQEKTRGGVNKARMLRIRQNITLDVIKAYLRAQIAKKSADLAVRLREKTEKRLETLRRQIEKSAVNEISGVENEINQLVFQYRFHSFETDYKNAKVELAKLMGLTTNTDFELVDLDFKAEAPKLDIDLAAFESEALDARPELKELNVLSEITRKEADGALIKMFPTLTPYVRYEHDDNSFIDRHDWNVTGLKFSWDLLSIPRHLSDRRISQSKLRKQAANRHVVAAAILTQVRLAVQDYKEIADVIGLVTKIAQKRKQLADSVNRMMNKGHANEATLLEAEQAYLAAQVNSYSIHAKLGIAVAKIYNTLGRSWEKGSEQILFRAGETISDNTFPSLKNEQRKEVLSRNISPDKQDQPAENRNLGEKKTPEPQKAIANLDKSLVEDELPINRLPNKLSNNLPIIVRKTPIKKIVPKKIVLKPRKRKVVKGNPPDTSVVKRITPIEKSMEKGGVNILFQEVKATSDETFSALKKEEQKEIISGNDFSDKQVQPEEKISLNEKEIPEPQKIIAAQKDVADFEQSSVYEELSNIARQASVKNIVHKPTQIKPTKRKIVKGNPPGTLSYSIILSHFRDKKYADQAMKGYLKRGLPTRMVSVDHTKSGKWWRVYTGFFHDRAKALSAARKNKLTGFQIIQERYANLINTYSSESLIGSEMKRLRSLGFYPYQVKISPTEYRLFVGAYKTMEDAELDSIRLRENGINSQAVMR